VVEAEGGAAVGGRHEGVGRVAAEQRRLADAVLAAQDDLGTMLCFFFNCQ
jgi:hypothetical protein